MLYLLFLVLLAKSYRYEYVSSCSHKMDNIIVIDVLKSELDITHYTFENFKICGVFKTGCYFKKWARVMDHILV